MASFGLKDACNFINNNSLLCFCTEEPEEKSLDLKVKEEIEKPVIKEEDNDGVSGVLDSETSVEQQPYTSKNEAVPKTETVPKTEATPVKFELLDDLADFHAGLQLKSSERVGVVNNLGPYRRALCARRDLAIRRSLCKVDKVGCKFALNWYIFCSI